MFVFKHKDYDGKSNVIIYVNSRVSIEYELRDGDGDGGEREIEQSEQVLKTFTLNHWINNWKCIWEDWEDHWKKKEKEDYRRDYKLVMVNEWLIFNQKWLIL